MSAIKQYFINQREVDKRKQEARKRKLAEKIASKTPVIVEDVYAFEEEFSEIDFLLRRNWFGEDSDIIDLLWDISEESFGRIMENLNTYPQRVRYTLISGFKPKYYTDCNLTKLPIKELTDGDLQTFEKNKYKELDQSIEIEWQKYKKERGLSRPEGDKDDKYTELYEEVNNTKKLLEDEVKKPTSIKYVPVHMRGKVPTVSPEVEKLQNKIKEIENEITKIKKEIKQEEEFWENDKRAESMSEIINKVFQV